VVKTSDVCTWPLSSAVVEETLRAERTWVDPVHLLEADEALRARRNSAMAPSLTLFPERLQIADRHEVVRGRIALVRPPIASELE